MKFFIWMLTLQGLRTTEKCKYDVLNLLSNPSICVIYRSNGERFHQNSGFPPLGRKLNKNENSSHVLELALERTKSLYEVVG